MSSMDLKDKYYRIINRRVDCNSYIFEISLLSGHDVYNGHFPGNPVSPGVLSIQIIRECCEDILEKNLTIKTINLCRFISVLRPIEGEVLYVSFTLEEKSEGEYLLVGQITNNELTYVTIKESLQA